MPLQRKGDLKMHTDELRGAAMLTARDGPVSRRLCLVEEHVRSENLHDLDAIMGTFGEDACYDDEPAGERHIGREAVGAFYAGLLRALPDLSIDVIQRHVAEETILLEVVVVGTHTGTWRGLPGTGRRVSLPLCGIYTFDAGDKLAGERIYYDRATLLRQLGLFHDPLDGFGRLLAPLLHPVTIARALGRKLGR